MILQWWWVICGDGGSWSCLVAYGKAPAIDLMYPNVVGGCLLQNLETLLSPGLKHNDPPFNMNPC